MLAGLGHLLLLGLLLAGPPALGQQQHGGGGGGGGGAKREVNRKSIVFDVDTPKVFYCQQHKQSDQTKMIVKAKPLEKLCEFGGKAKPRSSPSDCYNDVDETEFGCEEKKRFMLRVESMSEQPLGEAGPLAEELIEYVIAKDSAAKKLAGGWASVKKL